MYNFNKLLTIENVLNKVSEYQIFKYYVPTLAVGKSNYSPFRNESNPSFTVFKSNKGNLMFNDFSISESGDWIKMIKILFNVSTIIEVLKIVNNDLNLGLYGGNNHNNKKVIIPNDIYIPDRKQTIIKVKYRDWNKDDYEFWSKYGITISQLIKSKTYPISHYWINNSQTILADKLSYVYHFYEYNGIDLMKIYQPYSKVWKWTTNLNGLVIDGIKELSDNTELLIITKSRKDRLVLNNLDYDAISVNSESSFIPKEEFYKLNNIYKQIILFYDNDTAGVRNSEEISIKYDINDISIPISWNVKDISDFVKEYNLKLAKEVLTKLINKL